MADQSALRLRMLEAAEAQLAASPDQDVSTRAVCEAVGVGQPVLYRMFGDKAGLLSALVDHGFDRYVQRKRALVVTEDPVADLRRGWDDHLAFALEHPAIYRLMFSPNLAVQPDAQRTIFALLMETLERCAELGLARVPPADAAQRILAANIGVALALLVRPDIYADAALSTSVRDAIFAACVTTPETNTADQGAARTALQLAAQLRRSPTVALGAEEQQLLLKWLDALDASA